MLLRVPLWRAALLRHGTAAAIEHVKLLRAIGDMSVVVDIGANKGQFALIAHQLWPSAQIHSFEPLPGPSAIFQSVFSGLPKVRLVQSAVGPQSGDVTIHVSGRDDSSSLLPITERQGALFPGTAEAGTCAVRVGRLLDFLPAAALSESVLLKIDVQGYELQALAGCSELLNRVSWIYVECSFVELYQGQALADEVIGWLHVRGFRLRGVHQVQYDAAGHAIQADFLFRRNLQDVR